MKHVMCDLETLGTVADACILSIGAVKFTLESQAIEDAGFYASISIASNQGSNRRIQEDTMKWWMKQDQGAQNVFHEPKQDLTTALTFFSDWIGDDDCYMWSNGADFDLPMLAHAFTSHNIDIPWKFWNSRCFRTYKNLPGARNLKSPPVGVKHNALTDAFTQAQMAQLIYSTLFSGKPHAMVKTA